MRPSLPPSLPALTIILITSLYYHLLTGRKLLVIPSRPVVTLVDLWTGGKALCDPPRYLLHSYYYQIPLLNVCPAVTVCFGRGHMPKSVYEVR